MGVGDNPSRARSRRVIATAGRAPKIFASHIRPQTAERANPAAAWLILLGIIVPASTVQIYLAGAKLTAGRIGIVLLLLPALFAFFQKGRRTLMLSDFLAVATVAWMLFATVSTSLSGLSSTGAEGLEFVGAYLVARTFFVGPAALQSFVRGLKFFVTICVILGAAETVSGQLIVHNTLAALLHSSAPLLPAHRLGLTRALSTFDHPILFGDFCTIVAAIFLYSERNVVWRVFWVGICFTGCFCSLSAAPFLSFFIIVSLYAYDQLLRRSPIRWTALWVTVIVFITLIFLITDHPIGWIISHMTLDPVSGYYRLLIWNLALPKISLAPFTGYSFESLNQDILDNTIDCVWLVLALRFGIPMIALLFLTNVAACLPTAEGRKSYGSTYMHEMRLAFTIVLVMFMLNGLTVHYWNYIWIFWGLCVGVRASFREQSI